MKFQPLVDFLNSGPFQADVEDLLDTLWLASLPVGIHLSKNPGKDIVSDGKTSQHREANDFASSKYNDQYGDPIGSSESDQGSGNQPVFDQGEAIPDSKSSGASPAILPGLRALHDRLAITRALRPYSQRRKSSQNWELDEEQTVETTATLKGRWYPIFRRSTERWYSVYLVVEDDDAMPIWREALLELQRVLRNAGVFKNVSMLRIIQRKRDDASFGHDFFIEIAQDRLRQSKIYLSRNEPHLILFATHGASENWVNGSYARLLRSWLPKASVAVLQLMPRHRWKRTILGEEQGYCRAFKPGIVGTGLDVERYWWSALEEGSNQRHDFVPIVSLEPARINEWALMQMARGKSCSGVFLDNLKPENIEDIPAIYREGEIHRTIEALKTDWPEAFTLAVYLSTRPFTLPVARLVHEATSRNEARTYNIAGVLLSGLAFRRDPSVSEHFDDNTYYDFYTSAKAILQRSIRRTDAFRIAEHLNDYVSKYFELIGHRFKGLRATIPNENGIFDLPVWAQPFASVGRSLLRIPDDGIKPDKKSDIIDNNIASQVIKDYTTIKISSTNSSVNEKGEILTFTISADELHVEATLSEDTVKLAESLIKRDTKTLEANVAARSLFEILIPNEIKKILELKRDEYVLLLLDYSTLRFPWEKIIFSLLNNIERPGQASFGIIRQLRDIDTANADKVTTNMANRRALVIGDPRPSTPSNNFPALPGARAEAETVAQILSEGGYEVFKEIGSDPTSIIAALFATTYDILHFAGSGVLEELVEEERVTGMVLGDGLFITPGTINQMRNAPRFVFLNGCYLGGIDSRSFTRGSTSEASGSLSIQFLRLGSEAVVAPVGAIADVVGEGFARAFYESFSVGKSLMEATATARMIAFRDNREGNTWAAYNVYGDPRFTLKDWRQDFLGSQEYEAQMKPATPSKENHIENKNTQQDREAKESAIDWTIHSELIYKFGYTKQRSEIDLLLESVRPFIIVICGKEKTGHRHVQEFLQYDLKNTGRLLWQPVARVSLVGDGWKDERSRGTSIVSAIAKALGRPTDYILDDMIESLGGFLGERCKDGYVVIIDIQDLITIQSEDDEKKLLHLVTNLWPRIIKVAAKRSKKLPIFLLLGIVYEDDDETSHDRHFVERLGSLRKVDSKKTSLRLRVLSELQQITPDYIEDFLVHAAGLSHKMAEIKSVELAGDDQDNEQIITRMGQHLREL